MIMPISTMSIIIPISSADYIPYLNNCLNSIDKQTNLKKTDVLLVYTYQKNNAEDQNKITEYYKSLNLNLPIEITFYQHKLDDYPLALARNVGARKTEGNIIGFVDADLVLDPRIIGKIWELIPRFSKAACVNVYRMSQPPNNPIYKQLDRINWKHNLRTGRVDHAGKGGCFFIDRRLFYKLRGYDERLYGWGWEDDDFYRRLDRSKERVINLTSFGIFAMHQFHEHKPDFRHRYEKNRDISLRDCKIARNPDGWGGL
jgi:predicted glycosyltransferase involved in capsule biosynthesis